VLKTTEKTSANANATTKATVTTMMKMTVMTTMKMMMMKMKRKVMMKMKMKTIDPAARPVAKTLAVGRTMTAAMTVPVRQKRLEEELPQ